MQTMNILLKVLQVHSLHYRTKRAYAPIINHEVLHSTCIHFKGCVDFNSKSILIVEKHFGIHDSQNFFSPPPTICACLAHV